jgi:hypothetical protein
MLIWAIIKSALENNVISGCLFPWYRLFGLTIDDEEKTKFIMPFEIFCYTKTMFGLKNGGATNQKCVHTVLESQIGWNVEAYIDDIVVMSEKRGDLCLITSNRPSTICVSSR